MAKKKLICLLFAFLLLAGCNANENATSYKHLDDIPSTGELPMEDKEEACRFIYSHDKAELINYIENEYKKLYDKTEGVELKSINVYEDTETIDIKRKIVEHPLVVDMELIADMTDKNLDDLYKSSVRPVQHENFVSRVTVEKANITFIDKDTGEEYSLKASNDLEKVLADISLK